MSYQVLARTWRPRTFQQMVGQEHILRMLTNALDNQRLHHAYLFTGTRGVGKTTLARIFAKCLNCESGITSQPCGTCKTCQAIDAGKFLDLIEVDAASRTKVEDTRELLDNVQYTPTQGRFKIYLIDEVHMLSGHSFNALLKTLEEPPSYVKFLLATTDPKRLPITILSRCLQFNLNRVAIEKITQQLAHICTTEKIAFESPALQLIAQAADGSMRDALSLLDQTIAFCGENITTQDTQHMLGSIEQDAIFRLLNHLAEKNGKNLLEEITKLAEHAPSFSQVLEDLLSILHKINIAQIIPDAADIDDRIKKLAGLFSAEDVQLYYQIALIGRRDLALAPHPHQGFEMTLLRMLAFHPVIKSSAVTLPNGRGSDQAPQAQNPSQKPSRDRQGATPVLAQEINAQNWAHTLPKLGLSGMSLALASNCKVESITKDKFILTLAAKHEPMLNKKLIERIEQALNQYTQQSLKLEITLAATEMADTPAQQHQQRQTERQQRAREVIKNDDHVQKIVDIFGATIDMGSIQAVDPV